MPTAPTSTALLLTNGTPESIDLRFSCAAALRAETGGGVLFSTMRPEDPSLEKVGFINGGWLAFTAPEKEELVSLDQYIPAHAAVTVSWQFALLFPCMDQLKVQHGITQPPAYAITWPFSVLLSDVTWQVNRGGLTGTATKLGSMVSPASYLTDSPDVNWGKIYRFRYQYSPSACNLSVERDVVPGWRGIVSDRVSLSNVGSR